MFVAYRLLVSKSVNFLQFIFLAVKRLMKEAQELRDPTEQYYAQPLEVSIDGTRILVIKTMSFFYIEHG